ncbi:OmpL47-type beta-barrel domain-containing protein, partial [Salirhabdus salicampi]|uniref:OmpL47-type beta-barrel domain-containing protein n=1 Tax=Salirhabdus salicampi TaxID=476102 RepID=UPI003F59098B|nr:hypothetical protein [Salirhabdus salicampi]
YTNYYFRELPEGSYTYEVTSVSERFGESSEAATVTFDVIHPEMVEPENLSYLIRNGNDYLLRWDEVEYADTFKIYQVEDGERTLIDEREAKYTNYYFRELPEGSYTYEVTSVSERFGESSEAATVTFDVIHPEMVEPENLSYLIRNGNDYLLRWDEVEYADTFKIYQVEDGERTLIDEREAKYTSYYFRDLPEASYTYEVTSVSERFGESSEAATVTFDVIHPEMVEPGNLSYLIRNGNDYLLRWDEVEYANTYKIYQVNDGERTLVDERESKYTSYYFRDLPEGSYTYEVTSTSERFGESSEVATLTFDVVYPEMQKPINLKHVIRNGNDVILGWDEVEYADAYKIYHVEEGIKTLLEEREAKYTNYYIKALPEGNYTYEVTAISDRFGESNGAIEEVSIDFPEVEAPELMLKSVTDNNALLSWDEINNINEYYVYEVINEELHLIDTTDRTSYYVKDIEDGTHQYVVTAVHSRFGESKNSNTVEVEIISDITPPVTESNITEEWLNDQFMVDLTATDDKSGVDKTFYSVNGSEFKEGTSFVVTEEGVNEVSFYSVDKAGNVEDANTVE